jgi:hypothetical protein
MVLDEWIQQGILATAEADEIAHQMLHKNAESIYGIKLDS